MKHPYFKDEDEEDEEERKANEEELADGVKENCFPPLDVREKLVKKDSCLTFKLNKDTVFTGKTEAV